MTNGHGFRDWMQGVMAPAVLLTLVGVAATSGYIVGRDEHAAAIAELRAQVLVHTHDGSVKREEYEADKARIFESLSEIKALVETLRQEQRQ